MPPVTASRMTSASSHSRARKRGAPARRARGPGRRRHGRGGAAAWRISRMSPRRYGVLTAPVRPPAFVLHSEKPGSGSRSAVSWLTAAAIWVLSLRASPPRPAPRPVRGWLRRAACRRTQAILRRRNSPRRSSSSSRRRRRPARRLEGPMRASMKPRARKQPIP
jgi:hypothetical protein